MSQTNLKFPSVYNPATQSAEEIVANFVVRLREFDELFTAVKNDDMENPPQHFLIQGQRGYGKTTLLLRLNLAIKSDIELNSWLIPILFDEEQYSVHTLAKLWEKVIEILEENNDAFEGLANRIDCLYDRESPEEEIFKLLSSSLNEGRKKLVLLIDNFGEIIEKFSKKENQRLREVLITSNFLRIVGTSSTILEFYYNYKEPLFDFFKVITLAELDRSETIFLLQRLSETYAIGKIDRIFEAQPERIDALRKLTGGVPRTIVLLFEIFVDDVDGNSFKDLEKIMDRVTPLYKHRMDNLSTQQQSIIAVIAENWDAISTKDIAKVIRMASKAVSSQLNQLEKNQLVEKIPTSTKNNLYQIKERFFNIYYLMRLGKRKNRNKVLWLVRFLEIWCCQKELVDRTKKHIAALQNDRLCDKHAFYFSQALAQTEIPLEIQDELVSETRKFLESKKSEYAKKLEHSHFEVFRDAIKDIKQDQIESAKKKLRKTGMVQSEIALNIGNILWSERKDLRKAADFFLEAAEEGEIEAMFNLANLFRKDFKDLEKAKDYYLLAADKGHTGAQYNLATLFWKEFKNIDMAKEYYLMAVENGDMDAMYNLANLFRDEFKDFEKAKEYYLMGVDKGDVSAMYNLANLFQEAFKDFEKAKEYYLMAVDKGHRDAMYNLAFLFRKEFKDSDKAIKYYLMAVDQGDTDAMNNLAWLYFELKEKKTEALNMQREAYKINSNMNYAHTLIILLLWNDEINEAVKIYQKIFENTDAQKTVNQFISSILIMFLAKKQFNYIHRLFQENKYDIKDKYKPIYYTLLFLLGSEYQDEFKKMGNELKETVQEILKEIEKMAI